MFGWFVIVQTKQGGLTFYYKQPFKKDDFNQIRPDK